MVPGCACGNTAEGRGSAVAQESFERPKCGSVALRHTVGAKSEDVDLHTALYLHF